MGKIISAGIGSSITWIALAFIFPLKTCNEWYLAGLLSGTWALILNLAIERWLDNRRRSR